MRHFILLSVFFGISAAILAGTHPNPSTQYAGTTASGALGNLTIPSVSTTGCVDSGLKAPYQMFTFNVTTAAFYQFSMMAENQFKGSATLYLYSSFLPTNSCLNLLGYPLRNWIQYQGGPISNEGRYLGTGTYTVIISADADGKAGIFAVNIWTLDFSASTTAASSLWFPPNNGVGTACYTNDMTSPYASFPVSVSAAGLYDIYVFYYNASVISNGNTNFALSAAFYASTSVTFNATTPDSCTANGGAVNSIYTSGYIGTILQNVTMNANTNYTVVVSGANADPTGFFGVSIRPTIVFATTANTWAAPDHPSTSTPSACTGSNAGTFYYPFTFTAQFPTYILDTQTALGTSFDTFSFLYYGTWNKGIAPPTCPIIYGGDTGDVTPLAIGGLAVGQNYTIFVAPFSGTGSAGRPFALYYFAGNQLGTLPTSAQPTSAATTGGNTNATATATTGNTNATATAGTTAGTTKASAGTITVYLAFMLVSIALLF